MGSNLPNNNGNANYAMTDVNIADNKAVDPQASASLSAKTVDTKQDSKLNNDTNICYGNHSISYPCYCVACVLPRA
jgi:hypothetical protein